MSQDSSKAKQFEFPRMISQFGGYVSSVDKTNIAENLLVGGSQNIYKKLSGTYAVRQGQKRQGAADATLSKCFSEFVWNTSLGTTYTMVVSNSTLYAVINEVWYALQTGLTKTRYVFDKWWDTTLSKDELLFVNGTSNLYMWSGGVATIASGSSTAISLKGNSASLTSPVVATGTAPFTSHFNSLTGTSFEGSLIFTSNPTNGQTLILNINGSPVSIQFVSVIGAVAGNVLIGATLADTLNNLAGLLTSPATTSATQVALSGGDQTLVGYLTSAVTSTITETGLTSWQAGGFTNSTFTTIGSSTTQFDITNPSGTTFRYTWDTTGTNPLITATTVPVGSYILLQAENFNAANKGLFTVTGVGANYFEVTNASGVAENNKTIGTGFIYTKFTKVVMINGVPYAYTGGVTTDTLTGVTPNPSALTTTIALQSVITYPNTPTSTFLSDFLKVVNNQVYLGSYTSLNIFMSQNTDFTNYTVPTPQLDGSPGLFIMPGTAKGIGVRQGNAFVGAGTDNWVEISFTLVSNNNIITRTNKIDYKPVARLQAPYAHEFIDSVGDTIVYLAQDQQVRALGDFNNLFVAGYPSYSQEIATELMQENFSGGGLKAIGEFVYVTAPVSGKVYLRQERTKVDGNGTIVAERLWHSPFIWNATFIDVISGVVVAFSNANPQIYEVWDTNQWYDDSPSDEQLPYSCVAAFGYRGEQRRQGLWSFDKQFTEGYITSGTPLNLTINYNYNGATNSITQPINSVSNPAFIFTTNADSLGDHSLGDESLGSGGEESDTSSLAKFKVINSLPIINCFEWQPIYSSDSANAQWELLALANTAEAETEQLPSFIINKIRNI